MGWPAWRPALVVGACVLSHWLLDLLVHVPDLPLYPGGGPRVGLGWWLYPGLALGVELAIFATGIALYLRVTVVHDRIGRWGLWALVALLLAIHLASVFGPPPPSVGAIAWAGHLQWLFVLAGWWIDRHRRSPVI